MSKRNIEWLIEEYGIQLCRTHPSLKGVTMRHKDAQGKAVATWITFSATKGVDRLDGPGGSDVALKVAYRSDKGTPERNSLIADAIDECFSSRYTGSQTTPIVSELYWLSIEDQDKSSDRPDSQNMRKFSYEIPFIAKVL